MVDIVTEQGTKLSDLEAAVPVAVDAALDAGVSAEDIQAASHGKAGVNLIQTKMFSGPFDESDMSPSAYDDLVETENPYDQNFVSDDNQRQMAATNAAILGVSRGAELQGTYEDALGRSPEESKSLIRDLALGELEEEFGGALQLLTENVPESLDADAAELKAQFKAELEQLDPTDNVLSYYRGFARAMNEGDKFSQEQVDDIAFAKYTQDRVSKIFDEDYGILDAGMDFAGMLFVPNLSYDTAELSKELGIDSYAGSYLNSGEFLSKVRAVVADPEVPVQQRMKFFDKLADQLADIEGNKQKQLLFLMGAAGLKQQEESDFDLQADKFDQLTGGVFLGSRVIKVIRGMNNLVQLAGAADVRTMGVVMDVASRSDDGAKAMGVPRVHALASVDPRTTVLGDILEGAPENVATKIRDELTIIDDLAKESINIAEEGLGLSNIEKAAAVEDRVKALARQDNIENVVGVPTSKGIAISYDVVKTVDRVIESPLLNAFTKQEAKARGAANAADVKLQEAVVEFGAESAEALKASSVSKEAAVTLQNTVDNLSGFKAKAQEGVVETPVTGTAVVSEKVTITQPYLVDDITGGFKQDKVSFIGQSLNKVLSPNFLQGKDKERVVQGFERAMFQSSKIKGDFNQALNIATKGINKTEAENVSNMLLKGDDEAKSYTFKELVNDGIGGNYLTEKEYTAYAGVRRVMDNAWVVKNSETRKKLIARDIKEITVDGQKLLTKPVRKLRDAKTAYKGSPHKSVLIPAPPAGVSTKLDNMDDESLENFYDLGYQLVRGDTMGSWFKNGDTNSAWALVRADEIKELPAVVMNKQAGYVTRVYKDANFFVKQDRIVSVDGVKKVMGQRTLRYFDNMTDAQKHLKNMAISARNKGEDFDDSQFRVLADREIRESELETDGIDMFGGLYTSGRGDKPLQFGLEGVEGSRQDAIESIQNYVNHIGNRYPIAEYRLGIEKAWMNQARNDKMLPPSFRGSFSEAFPVVQNAAGDTRIKTKLVNAHEHISFMVKTPTLGEQNLQGVIRSIGKSVEGTKAKGFAKYVYRLDNSDPIDALRGATFNLMLGMWNFSQVLVQGLGATIALSIHPVHGLKAIPKMLAFGYLDLIKNPKALTGAIEFLARNKALDVADVAEDYRLWKKTGLYESVVNTNADVSSVMQGLPYDAGVIRKILSTSTLFFKMGELANMRVSFATALGKWKSLNKGKVVTDIDLKHITAKAEQLRLQMSSANKAQYQKGKMALPTQFMQINAKFIEAVAGDNFTLAEKVRLFAGQGILFGAAGIPFGDWAYNNFMELSGRDITKMTEEELVAERRGFVGWMFNHQLGLNSSVTSRTAIGTGVVDTIVKYATEPMEAYNILLGPSASTFDSAVNVVKTTFNVGKIAVVSEDMTPAKYGSLAVVMGKSVGNLPSSIRNILLAYHLREGGAFRTAGGKFVYQEDQELGTIIMQGLGFSNQDYADYWESVMDEKSRAVIKDSTVTAVTNMYLGLFNAAETDEEIQEAYNMGISAMLSSFPDQADKAEILKGVRARIEEPRDPVGRQIKKVIANSLSALSKAGSEFNPLVIRSLEEAENANK